MRKDHPLLFCLLTSQVFAKAHTYWKSPLCDVTEGTESSPRLVTSLGAHSDQMAATLFFDLFKGHERH